jgi:phosphoribosylformimino-5-aminoimidazole carboxamide ribotide isomerase
METHKSRYRGTVGAMALVVIPSIDLREGKVVRLAQGDYGRQSTYAVDPVATAAGFAAAGARHLHVVDLDGAKAGRPVQTDRIRQIAAGCGLSVQAGGGVRTEEDIEQLFEAGIGRVVIGTIAMQNWDWFRSLVHRPRFEKNIVLAIDAREGVIATHGWTAASTRTAEGVAREVTDWPLAGLLYTDVVRDGMLAGPNVELTKKLAASTKVPVLASGGVGSVDHVRQLNDGVVWGVVVGRSLYEGKVDLAEAILAGK